MLLEVDEPNGWRLAHWALANANPLGISQINYAGYSWNRDSIADGHNVGWQASESVSAGAVSVLLPAPVPAE
ncbi:hypothetical protein NHF46_17090 [Arthrobacter alpinus]|nr:hypothetical protein [Arthrobacter alpinus]